jgi:hypothetical protein
MVILQGISFILFPSRLEIAERGGGCGGGLPLGGK